MNPFSKHILIPAAAPILILSLHLTPVSLFDGDSRAWMATAVVFISLVAGLVTGVFAFRASDRGDSVSGWWIASTCVLVTPALLVIGVLR